MENAPTMDNLKQAALEHQEKRALRAELQGEDAESSDAEDDSSSNDVPNLGSNNGPVLLTPSKTGRTATGLDGSGSRRGHSPGVLSRAGITAAEEAAVLAALAVLATLLMPTEPSLLCCSCLLRSSVTWPGLDSKGIL